MYSPFTGRTEVGVIQHYWRGGVLSCLSARLLCVLFFFFWFPVFIVERADKLSHSPESGAGESACLRERGSARHTRAAVPASTSIGGAAGAAGFCFTFVGGWIAAVSAKGRP